MVEVRQTANGRDMVQIVVLDHVPYVKPADYGYPDLKAVDPQWFFVTSGDAVVKAGVLEQRLWEAAGLARKQLAKTAAKNKQAKKLLTDLWSAAGKARVFVNYLKSIRGTHIFLETDHIDRKLYVTPKDPRAREVVG